MDKDTDRVADALRDFTAQDKKVVSNELREVIKDIAKKGRYSYQWEHLKPLYAHEIQLVMDNFLETFPPKNSNGTDEDKVRELENEKNSILKIFNSFASAPFTIQRLSELIIQPRKHYKTCAKFFRGLSKNLLVVSTVDPEEPVTSEMEHKESDTDESPPKKLRIQSEEGPRLETSNGQRTSVLQDGKAARNIALTNGEQQKPRDLDVMGSSMQDDKDAATAESTEETSKPRDASTAVGVESDEQVTSNQTEENKESQTADEAETDAIDDKDTCKVTEDVAKNPELSLQESTERKPDCSHLDTPL